MGRDILDDMREGMASLVGCEAAPDLPVPESRLFEINPKKIVSADKKMALNLATLAKLRAMKYQKR